MILQFLQHCIYADAV